MYMTYMEGGTEQGEANRPQGSDLTTCPDANG